MRRTFRLTFTPVLIGVLLSCFQDKSAKSAYRQGHADTAGDFQSFLDRFQKVQLPFSFAALTDDEDEFYLKGDGFTDSLRGFVMENGVIYMKGKSSFSDTVIALPETLIPKAMAVKWLLAKDVKDSTLVAIRGAVDFFYQDKFYWNYMEPIVRFETKDKDFVVIGIYSQLGVSGGGYTRIKVIQYNKQGKMLNVTDLGSYGYEEQKKMKDDGKGYEFIKKRQYQLIDCHIQSQMSIKVVTTLWNITDIEKDFPVDTSYTERSEIFRHSKMIVIP